MGNVMYVRLCDVNMKQLESVDIVKFLARVVRVFYSFFFFFIYFCFVLFVDIHAYSFMCDCAIVLVL